MKKKMKSGYMEPSKELTFGGPSKKMQDAGKKTPGQKAGLVAKIRKGGVPAYRLPSGKIVMQGSAGYMSADTTYTKQADKRAKFKADQKKSQEAADKATADRRGPSREEKQNTPQGTGANRSGKSGSNTDSKRVNQKLDELSNMPGPAKKSTYADAKKKDPKLDSYIKIRNNSEKGSPEHTSAQNKINKAYGRGPQRKVAPMKKVEAKKATKIPVLIKGGADSDKLKTKKSAPAPKPKSTPKANTGAGSGMGGVQREKDKIADLKSTPAPSATPDRRAKRKGRKAARQTKREAIKDAKGNLKAARKMQDAGMKTPSADQKGLKKLPTSVRNKMGYKRAGGKKMGYGGNMKYGMGGKKKAQLGGIMGAIGGAKGAQGGFGKKLMGAAKGALGGGMLGRAVGAVKGAMGGGGIQGAMQGFKGGAFGNSNPMGGGQGQEQAQPDTSVQARRGGRKDRRLKRADKAHASAKAKGKKVVGTRKGMGDPRMLNQPTVDVYAREKRIRDRVEKTGERQDRRKEKKEARKKNRKGISLPRIRRTPRPLVGIGEKNIFGNYKKVKRKKLR